MAAENPQSAPGLIPAFNVRNPAGFAEDLAVFRGRVDAEAARLLEESNRHQARLAALGDQADFLGKDLADLKAALNARVAEEMEELRKELRRNEAAANRVRDSLEALDAEVRHSLSEMKTRRTVFPVILFFVCLLEAALFALALHFSGVMPWNKA